MKIGIMGGTFNPIHQGHLIQCEIVRQEKGLDRIIFLPSSNPPHKRGGDVLDSQIRKEMVELAIRSNPHFQLSDLEIRRPGLSYTVDSLKEFRRIYPQDELFLLVGVDSLLGIHKWKDYEKILSRIKILVMARYNSTDINLEERVDYYNRQYGNNIEIIPSPIIEISSTNIRERIRQGKSIKYLLPQVVEEYIRENQVYTREGYDG